TRKPRARSPRPTAPPEVCARRVIGAVRRRAAPFHGRGSGSADTGRGCENPPRTARRWALQAARAPGFDTFRAAWPRPNAPQSRMAATLEPRNRATTYSFKGRRTTGRVEPAGHLVPAAGAAGQRTTKHQGSTHHVRDYGQDPARPAAERQRRLSAHGRAGVRRAREVGQGARRDHEGRESDP